MQPENFIEIEICNNCNSEQPRNFNFCSKCGSANSHLNDSLEIKKLDYNIRFLGVYSIANIILLIIAYFTPLDIIMTILWSLLFATVDVIFAFYKPIVFKSLNFRSFKITRVLLIICGFIFSALIVSNSVNLLNETIFEEYYEEINVFLDSDYPVLYSIIFTALFPALFEELAFRGFVFDSIKEMSGTKAAIIGSAFIFSLVHFSLISLYWLFPFGLILGYFRHKYSTIWYGVLAHFVHNSSIVLLAFYF